MTSSKIQWKKDGSSKCGRFWTMNTRAGWRIFDTQAKQDITFKTFKECKEWADHVASK